MPNKSELIDTEGAVCIKKGKWYNFKVKLSS